MISKGEKAELNYDQIIANDNGNLLLGVLIEEKKLAFITYSLSIGGVMNIEDILKTFGSGRILRLITFWEYLIILFSDEFLGVTLSVYTERGNLTHSEVINDKKILVDAKLVG